jgi:hypothetical protein
MQPDISYSIDTIYYLLKKGSVFILFNYLFYFKMINFYYIQLNFRRESERTVTLYSGNLYSRLCLKIVNFTALFVLYKRFRLGFLS